MNSWAPSPTTWITPIGLPTISLLVRTIYYFLIDFVSPSFLSGMMTDLQGVNPDNQLMGFNGQPTPLGWEYLG
jgi:hypothetical protein